MRSGYLLPTSSSAISQVSALRQKLRLRRYETRVLLSSEGTYRKGDDVKETGPVYDPVLDAAFFDVLERNLSLAPPDTGGRVETKDPPSNHSAL